MPNLQTTAAALLLITLATILILGLGTATTPLCIAIALSYICFPAVNWLESYSINRHLAVGVTLLAVLGILSLSIVLIIPYLTTELQLFIAELPKNTNSAIHAVELYATNFGIKIPTEKTEIVNLIAQYKSQLSIETINSVGQIVKNIFSNLLGSLLAILNIFLVPIFFCYVISDYEKLREQLIMLIPAKYRATAQRYGAHFNQILKGFIRGQFMVALILSMLFSICLYLAGLKYGLIIGLITGLLSFIPFVGFFIGTTLAILILLATKASFAVTFGTLLSFAAINICENFLLIPKFVGNALNISALTTILALIIGGNIAGVIGIILAIPMACMVKYMIKDMRSILVNI